MAVDVTLTDVASGYNRGAINDNFTDIEVALQDALSRSGDSPNTMSVDIDLNDNDLLNVGVVNTSSLKVAGVSVVDASYVPDWKGPWATTTSYAVNDLTSEAGSSYICLVSHTSGTFSADLTSNYWELFAQQGSSGAGTGDMLAANNLSDVANIATSRSNIGLGDIATQNKSSVDITGGAIVGITDIAIADGGTGASTASGAFDNIKQVATTSETGVIEKATTAQAQAGVLADTYADVVGVKAAIDSQRPVPYESGQQTIVSAGTISLTHGLGKRPLWVQATLECTTAEDGYSIGDFVPVTLINNSSSATSRANGVKLTSTQILIRFSNQTECFIFGNDTAGVLSNATNANWKLHISAGV